MPSFTESDLHISQSEIDQIKAVLANTGVPDGIPLSITEAVQLVDTYTERYAISDDHYRRLMRPIVMFKVYSLIQSVSDSVQKAYDEVMKELRDIRDGKFPDLTIEAPASSTSKGSWGSETKRSLRE